VKLVAASGDTAGRQRNAERTLATPSISLPKGGGAIRGIGEKFGADPVTGTGTMTIPIATSPARSGFGPQLALSYDSGTGNGPFGVGWRLSLPSITRKTDRGVPRYRDADESDVFLFSGAEDLVPLLDPDGHPVVDATGVPDYSIARYRPRIEGGFARIERWTHRTTGDVHWRTLSRDNILSVYGRDTDSRIVDPADAGRVFSWLLCETRDDRGNAIHYTYRQEDATDVDVAQPCERGRGKAGSPVRTANRYLTRIRYGNRVPLLDGAGHRPVDVAPGALLEAGWMFEVVFDYGEHSSAKPKPDEGGAWLCRKDPFSSYRPGFEVRTYRLCQRILMFHQFPDEPGIGTDCLVRSTDFAYRDGSGTAAGVPGDARHGDPIASFVDSVTQTGYLRAEPDGYTRRALPPVRFEYGRAAVSSQVQRLDPGSLENTPAGLDGVVYQWVDLNGEGLAGVLTEQADAWFYKPNLGEGRFGPLQPVGTRPSIADLRFSGQRLLDLAGNGRLDLVQFDRQPAGFVERTDADGWENYVPFAALPEVDWASANLQLVDLTGDGHADLLFTDDEAFTWYPSLGEAGFGPARRVPVPSDEERGPRLVLADGTQSIFLADMSGDGLPDLVRVRNGEVCYWPSIGYGRFGAKVTMNDAPRFDQPDRFDPRRIRLADIDGSGDVDILYLGADAVRMWFNQSGNGWSAPRRLADLPHLDDRIAVQVADLLGNGTACLVWSSPLPTDARCPLLYIDLMGGTKPHLLVKVTNNLGAETHIRYAASTTFYLADRRAGRPWITRLPFPVHVVAKVEHIDHVSRSRLVTRYTYHHGYFDGVEREFRGFGMVEQHDTEAFEDYVAGVERIEGSQEQAPELYQPPVTTRTWFHTGAYLGRDRILHQLSEDYYLRQQHLPEPVLEPDMDERELRECVRALKGLALRQEVYSFDDSAQAKHPYSVTENSYDVRRLQARAGQRHAAFFAYGSETVTHHYERDPADPRIAHSFNLEVGPYGNVVRSASVVHGRTTVAPGLPAEVTHDQQQLRITCHELDYTPDIDRLQPVPAYRLRIPYESRDYEITGVEPAGVRFARVELTDKITGAAGIGYEVVADQASAQKRLLSHSRTLFRADNGLVPLPLGLWDTLGLGYESYRLAFTPPVVAAHYAGKVTDADFTKAGYVHFDGDANWWIPSGTDVYPADPPAHFYLPIGAKDALGLETVAVLDRYDLLPELVRVTPAPWNEVRATNDYRVLGAVVITDPNHNRTAVQLDELGLVVRSALMGKAGAVEGDTLTDPTTRLEYDLFNWVDNGRPNYVHVFARERHGSANPRWQESYVYSNGSGGVAMVKAQAHPGKALRADADGGSSEVETDHRWIGSGRTVDSNKGKPVKRYQPFFSTTHEYEDEEALRTIGATPVLYYDAAGRNVRTDFPNGTFARTAFDPWTQWGFDANDTVLESRWYAERGSPDPDGEAEPLDDPERRAAWLAARHAGTPAVVHLDSLGRPAYAVSDHGNGTTAGIRSEADLTGRHTKVFDQHGRQVAGGFTGMAGTPVHAESAEMGGRWTFLDVLGAVVHTWDEHGREFRVEYDVLHRPVGTVIQEAGRPETLFNYVVYGDRHPDAVQLNLLGRAHQVFDSAGAVRVRAADFKGNPTAVERVLARDYKSVPDWRVLAAQPDYPAVQLAADAALAGTEPFTAGAAYDALNRPVQLTLPGGTTMNPSYNETNLLSSLRVQIEGQGPFVEFLKGQDYDAKGQRLFAHCGNDVLVRYLHDPQTFRLTNLVAARFGEDPATSALQDLHYTYDPVGNVTQVDDAAQQTHFFRNSVVKAECRYEYDAHYQLVKASGREHAGLSNDDIRDDKDIDEASLPHVNDASAVRRYTESYEYDLLGNLVRMRHTVATGPGSWTRGYRYAYQDDPADATNRLTATSRPGDPADGPFTATYGYDDYGNMTRLRTPAEGELVWNFLDQLQQVDLGGGGTAYYVYGMDGQRIRKVIERHGAIRTERIYLGALEIYRERRGDDPHHFERRTVHVADNAGRIAQVDVKTRDDDGTDPANPTGTPVIRYQYGNHLGSATLETDAAGAVISYEEYHPFGTTAYRSGKPGVNLSLKRYRFSGKERDDETGLYYVGARYYAPWLGRWTSPDPAGFVSTLNLYVYCRNSPICREDPDGMDDRCLLVLGAGGFVPVDLQPGGCYKALKEGKLNPAELAPGTLPHAPVAPARRAHPKATAHHRAHGRRPAAGGSAAAPGGPDTHGPGGGSPAPPDPPPTPDPPPPPAAGPASRPGPGDAPTPSPAGSAPTKLLPWIAGELSSTGAVRVLDSLKKANLGRLVETLLKNQTVLDNLQRVSRYASNSRQALRAADQAAGGFLNQVASRLLDKNGSRTWGYFVNKALAGRRGEEALAEAYTAVARSSAIARESANKLGMASRVAGGALGGIGMVFAGIALQENLSQGHWFDAFVDATSFVSSGLAFGGAIAGSVALAEAGLVIGAFGIGVLIGTGIDKGLGWLGKKLFGVDLSPSSLLAEGMTAIDEFLTPLWADPTKPAYTQTFGWKLGEWLGI